jgi:hypothetical protein
MAAKTPLRRFDARTEVLDRLVRGALHRAGETLAVALRDVSDHGLKLALDKRLGVGERVRVAIAHPIAVTLVADVRWCEATGGDDPYLAGLKVEGAQAVLEELQRHILEAAS